MDVCNDPESKYGVLCGAETVLAFPPTLINSDASPQRRDFSGQNASEDVKLWEATYNALRTMRKLPSGLVRRNMDQNMDTTFIWTGHNKNLPAFARLGLKEETQKALDYMIEKYQMLPAGLWCYWGWDQQNALVRKRKQPDGTEVDFPANPYYIHVSTEPTGTFAVTIQEMLMNSSDGVIRVFHAYEKDAAFGLYAPGGFFVTSELKNKRVEYVRIESRLGNEAVVSLPWSDYPFEIIDEENGTRIKYNQTNDRITFPTRKTGSYLLKPKGKDPAETIITDVKRDKPRVFGKAHIGLERDF